MCTRCKSYVACCVSCVVCAPQRPPAKRGPAVVSLAFTGLALAPLALLVIYLGMLGVNFKVRRHVHTRCARLPAQPWAAAVLVTVSPDRCSCCCCWLCLAPCHFAHCQGLPTGASNLWVMLFHGGIAAMLGLYLLFWVKLNLAQTAPLALLLGLFIAGVLCSWGWGTVESRQWAVGPQEQIMWGADPAAACALHKHHLADALIVGSAAAAAAMAAGTGWKALSAVSDERMAAEKSGSPGAVAKKTN